MSIKPTVVIGLGYGDEGKGMAVAHECDRLNHWGVDPVVVRFNGGPQAQHNVRVRTYDRLLHHVHSQIGSGALLMARTVLSSGMLVDPLALENEAMAFARLVNNPMIVTRITVDRNCPVVIPSFADANRAMERARGESRHGSTGRGIGVARMCEEYAIRSGFPVLTLGTLLLTDRAETEITVWREWISRLYRTDIDWSLDVSTEGMVLYDATLNLLRHGVQFTDDSTQLVRDHIANGDGVVFEGSQGMMLDERYGWFPHVTYGDMTPSGAMEIAGCPVRIVGVTRSYQTRHGAGPLPTEGTFLADEPDNTESEWAGGFRTGLLDIITTARMAREIDADEIAISCLDRYPGRYAHGLGSTDNNGWFVRERDEVDFIHDIEDVCHVPVRAIGRGNTTDHWYDSRTLFKEDLWVEEFGPQSPTTE